MGELIANENRKYKPEPTPLGSPWVPGNPDNWTFVEQKASKCNLSNKKALVGQITWTIGTAGGCTLAGYTFNGGTSTTPIIATTTKVKMDNLLVLRKGNSGVCAGSFTNPTPTTVICGCTVKIDDAGQTKVKGV